jgi:hypothetical protein
MKALLYYMFVFPLCVAALNASAFTNEETNSVASSILAYASMDNEDDLDAEADYPVRYTTWNGLLDSVSLPGWTREAKDAALFEYMLRQSTNDFSAIGGRNRELLRIGLCEYRDLNRTNALPIVRNWSVNPTAVFRGDALYVYLKWASLDQEFLKASETLLTNVTWMTAEEKLEACRGVSGVIGRYKGNCGMDLAYTNALHLVYRARSCNAVCGIVLDCFFVDEIAGYTMSSNRLDTVRGWLSSTNISAGVISHCVSVTNQLMNAAQPLPEVETLRGL